MSAESIARSRHVRSTIIDMLWISSGASAALGLSYGQLKTGFNRSRFAMPEAELRRELGDLADLGIVAKSWDEDLEDDYYTITARGRDFKRASMPWEKIDEFTGTKI